MVRVEIDHHRRRRLTITKYMESPPTSLPAPPSPGEKPGLHRRAWIRLVALGGVALAVDTMRAPGRELSSAGCVSLIHGYWWSKKWLHPPASCRFVPTCSVYSEEAFTRFGFWRGLELTASRLCRCRPSVPLHTFDPVPRE